MKSLSYYLPLMLKQHKFSTLLLVLLMFSSSCEDDNISSSDENRILPREGVSDPTLQYGYLLFEDRTHFLTFYDYLESVADTAANLSSSLIAIASRLGHTSLLYSDTSAFANPYTAASNFGKISDPLKRVILNSNHEVGIGDSLFVLQNRWETYTFPVSDSEMRDTLINTIKGTRVDIHKLTPSTRLIDSDSDIITNRSTICFQYNKILRADPCTSPLSVAVLAGATVFGIGTSFSMNIDWGDGNSTIDNTNLGDEKFTHTYTTADTYTIVSTLNTSCAGPIVFTAAGKVEVGGVCDGGDIDTSRWDDDDDIGMKMEAWSTKNLFGAHVGAKTTCYEYINNKWRERAGEVLVNIDADFRDVVCSVEDMDNETDDCNSCRSKRAVVTSSIHNRFHILGDATSTHSVERGGVELTGNIVLDYKCD